MTKRLIILILLLIPTIAFTQKRKEEEFVILTFEIDRNKDMHGTFVYYWIAELEKYEKVDEYKEPNIYSIFLQEFYSRNQLDSCCLGKVSYPYSIFKDDNFDFPENYNQYLTNLRELVKHNRVKLQVIRKVWKNNHKETVTVYGTAVRGKLCKCQNGLDSYVKAGDQISFPQGNFEIIENYWTDDKGILLYKDFSDFKFTNTSYRTNK